MPLSRRLLVGAMIAASSALSPAWADVRSGVEAWQNGNYPRAIAEWRPLAEQGDPDAQFNLAQAYKLGRGVAADLKQAQSWYEKAARQNHEEAQANLGLILFQNGEQEAGMVWIRKASDNGDPRARYVLATALFNGDMVAKDWPRAYALMSRASAQGLTAASDSLSQMDNVLPESQRQEGMKLARELARGDANREGTAGEATPSKAPPRPATGPVQVAGNVPAAEVAPPPVSPPIATSAPKSVEVASATVDPAPPAEAEAEAEAAAAARVPDETAMPTWRTGRSAKAARTARSKASQSSAPAVAAAPTPTTPPQVDVAAVATPTEQAQPADSTLPSSEPVPPVETASAAPLEVVTADAPATPPQDETAAVAAPVAPAETALPTWRTGRSAKAAKPARRKTPQQLSEAAQAPPAPAPAQIEVAAAATQPQPVEPTPAPQVEASPAAPPAAPAAPVEVAAADTTAPPAPAEVAPVEPTPAAASPAPAVPTDAAPVIPPVAPATPVAVAVADTPAPAEPAPAEPQQLSEFAAAVIPPPPNPASPPEPVPPPAGEAAPSPAAAAPAQIEQTASAVPTDTPPVPAEDVSATDAKPVKVASAAPPKLKAKAPSRPLTAVGGKWRVQLGAYGTLDLAKGQWAMLTRKDNALAGLKPSYEPAGALTRLRINALTDRTAAEKVCTAAKAAGQACLLIAP